MKKRFDAQDWKNYVPIPVCEQFPEYEELYWKAWELAGAHVKSINGRVFNVESGMSEFVL